MIDIDNEIFSAVYDVITSNHPKCSVAGEYTSSPPSFPHVSVAEIGNVVFNPSSTSDEIENHSEVTYEVNVYSNLRNGKKTECRKIIKTVDELLLGLGFKRIVLESVPNLGDATIYRLTGRYRAVVGQNHIIYRR